MTNGKLIQKAASPMPCHVNLNSLYSPGESKSFDVGMLRASRFEFSRFLTDEENLKIPIARFLARPTVRVSIIRSASAARFFLPLIPNRRRGV